MESRGIIHPQCVWPTFVLFIVRSAGMNAFLSNLLLLRVFGLISALRSSQPNSSILIAVYVYSLV